MTGHGESLIEYSGGGTIMAEVRSVNNRHLKISLRTSDGLGAMEPAIETLIRSDFRRGAIQLSIFWRNRPALEVYQIQAPIAESYIRQCKQLSARLDIDPTIRWADLLILPGVVSEPIIQSDKSPELEETVLRVVQLALQNMDQMRAAEGAAMQREMKRQLQLLSDRVDHIELRAPQVVAEYRQRLKARVATAIEQALGEREFPSNTEPSVAMAATTRGSSTAGRDKMAGDPPASRELQLDESESSKSGSSTANYLVNDSDLVREIALITDKSDVREEIVRLRSHFCQFGELLSSTECQGRRLDFLVQEMFREANTIGSKAADATISQQVVEIKATLEQIRELVQNVE